MELGLCIENDMFIIIKKRGASKNNEFKMKIYKYIQEEYEKVRRRKEKGNMKK
jgi:hypothetical protein